MLELHGKVLGFVEKPYDFSRNGEQVAGIAAAVHILDGIVVTPVKVPDELRSTAAAFAAKNEGKTVSIRCELVSGKLKATPDAFAEGLRAANG